MEGKKLALTAAALTAAAGWVLYGNITVGVTRYTVTDDRLPPAFNCFKISVVSDLHNTKFGKNNRKLEALVRKERPDLIAVTGDMVDAIRTDIGVAAAFAAQLAAIAPVCYVTGNHEGRIGALYGELEARLRAAGVNVLRNGAVPLDRADGSIMLVGLDDPRFTGEEPVNSTEVLGAALQDMDLKNEYTVLLSHRPEAFGAYAANGINTALCGHAHGGQIRLPFFGGVFAPHQGFFPQYDAGIYKQNGTTMVVSRGLGNSQFPVRLNDRPELVTVELRTGC